MIKMIENVGDLDNNVDDGPIPDCRYLGGLKNKQMGWGVCMCASGKGP